MAIPAPAQRREETDAPERQAAAQPAPPAPVGAVLAMQRSAGNAAVVAHLRATGVLARDPVAPAAAPAAAPAGGPAAPGGGPAAPPPVAVEAKTPSAAEALTLADFTAFTERQADWHSQADFQADQVRSAKLRDALEWAQRGRDIAGACGAMNMGRLAAASGSDRTKLERYADQVAHPIGDRPAMDRTADVAEGITFGAALGELAMSMPERVIKETIPQTRSAPSLKRLIDASAIAPFVSFVLQTNPLLSATNGAEVDAYLALKAEADPLSYAGRVPNVRNLHHFSKDDLDAIIANYADTSRAKPLTLVVQSGVDHNGAFHRDSHMTEVLRARMNLTLMIEGPTSLSAAGATVASLTTTYGQGTPPKFRQLMLAGHGNARVTEMAADRDPITGEMKSDNVDLDANAAHSDAFLQTLLANMEHDPRARIALNACLTNSINARPDMKTLSNDPAEARRQVTEAVNAQPSLAAHVRALAAPMGIGPGNVSAANASFSDEASLIDPRTGELGLRSGYDPALTAPDKIDYVRRGNEPTGAMRAVQEVWVGDATAAAGAMRQRLAGARTASDWAETVIRGMYTIVLGDLTNGRMLNLLARTAGAISEWDHEDDVNPGALWGIPDEVIPVLFPHLTSARAYGTQRPPVIRLALTEVWMRVDAGKRPEFLTALTSFSVAQARRLLIPERFDIALLRDLLPDPAANADGELRLALGDLAKNRASAREPSKAYLRRLRGAGAAFPNSTVVDTALGGAMSVRDVLDAIADPAAPTTPGMNVDLNGDGINDLRIEPRAQMGVTIGAQTIRARPDPASAAVAAVADSQRLAITGTTGAFYAIEHGPQSQTRFVLQSGVLAL
jgi:hypothetical protein